MAGKHDEHEQFLLDQIPKIARMGGVVTARDVRRHFWMFRHGGECLLECMIARGFGEWVTCPPGPKGGRPTRAFSLFDKHRLAGTEADGGNSK